LPPVRALPRPAVIETDFFAEARKKNRWHIPQLLRNCDRLIVIAQSPSAIALFCCFL
jgi:hypothetical protein